MIDHVGGSLGNATADNPNALAGRDAGFCLGLSGSRVTELGELAIALREALVDYPAHIVSAYQFSADTLDDEPRAFDHRAVIDAIDTAKRSAAVDTASGRSVPVIAVLGPLGAVAAVAQRCDAVVFLEIDEQLAMLRWAEVLMDAPIAAATRPAAAGGSTAAGPFRGGIEALQEYSGTIEPRYRRWAAAAKASAHLVLEDAEGLMPVASKIAFFYEIRRSATAGVADAAVASAAAGVADAAVASAAAGVPGEVMRRAVGSRPARYPVGAVSGGRDARDVGDVLQQARTLEQRLRRRQPGGRLSYRLHIVGADVVYPAVKRMIDVLVVSAVFMLTWPVFVLVALLVWIDDPGPFFYVQTRVGRFGRRIKFPKFRTMVRNAEALKARLMTQNEMVGGITFKMKRDPRVLPIGRVLRKFSLDEIPQLWSVLRGDLTLVGPRPPVPAEVALYTARDRRRLEVVPGLTCIWQVSGRSDIPFAQQVELDVEYMERRSLLLDIRLLVATIPAVITGKGAY